MYADKQDKDVEKNIGEDIQEFKPTTSFNSAFLQTDCKVEEVYNMSHVAQGSAHNSCKVDGTISSSWPVGEDALTI